jgi:UDP-galactopyranose mutase
MSTSSLPSRDLEPAVFCFSHLRWHFVTQRPQHLMTRCATKRNVFFWEEPYWDADDCGDGTPTLELMHEGPNLLVLRPHLPRAGDADEMLRGLLRDFRRERRVTRYVSWYYTPMMLSFTDEMRAEATVYDCMDELSGFLGAPVELEVRERELFAEADVVFTGGMSLYEAKRKQHDNVHPFPSSIDVEHFASAEGVAEEPRDQADVPHPRVGFFGVLDERLDLALLRDVARLQPTMHFVLLGPVVKIDLAALPREENIHYLGAKSYKDLPKYIAGWDITMMPFAMNDATRFISPTKTPEYLAAGKPVVSTPIRDVVTGYGNDRLVAIARTAEEFAESLDCGLDVPTDQWRAAVKEKLAGSSWDTTWASMWGEIERVLYWSSKAKGGTGGPSGLLTTSVNAQPRRARNYEYLVVGAGFAGAVLAERLANVMGKRVLVVEKRDHIGGNAYDYVDDAGLLVHKYGPHIFHTNSPDVMQYLSRFTDWRRYEHRVLADVDQKLLPIPINLDTINQLYGLSLDEAGMRQFLAERTEHAGSIRTSQDICVSRVGWELYEKFFRNYTRKQWGLDPSELDASVAGRIPVRFDRDDRYFTDTFQAMPLLGYTKLFERMLDSPLITVQTSTNYADVVMEYPHIQTIFTGPVDEFFDYRFGPLPYRSLEFEHKTFDREWYQPAPVVNYPNEHAYTRVTEFKYLTGQRAPNTSVVFEYPRTDGDPYYPIPRAENTALYAKYKELAAQETRVHFVGRLATYKYYNMDQVVAQALALFRKLSTPNPVEEATVSFAPDDPATVA